jgi:hypothetical protein
MSNYCVNCADGLWVCESHKDRPWHGTSNSEDACDCGGAGEPCPVCNRGPKPRVKWIDVICSVENGDGK